MAAWPANPRLRKYLVEWSQPFFTAFRRCRSSSISSSAHYRMVQLSIMPLGSRSQGNELFDHRRLKLAAEVEIYFCVPRSPWQHGSNENTNRLPRQYLPRGIDLCLHSRPLLARSQGKLDERPRKTLLYQTPAEKLAECVAAESAVTSGNQLLATRRHSAISLSVSRLAPFRVFPYQSDLVGLRSSNSWICRAVELLSVRQVRPFGGFFRYLKSKVSKGKASGI